jgi:hypothetical protein
MSLAFARFWDAYPTRTPVSVNVEDVVDRMAALLVRATLAGRIDIWHLPSIEGVLYVAHFSGPDVNLYGPAAIERARQRLDRRTRIMTSVAKVASQGLEALAFALIVVTFYAAYCLLNPLPVRAEELVPFPGPVTEPPGWEGLLAACWPFPIAVLFVVWAKVARHQPRIRLSDDLTEASRWNGEGR